MLQNRKNESKSNQKYSNLHFILLQLRFSIPLKKKYPLHLFHCYSIFFRHERNKKMEKMENLERIIFFLHHAIFAYFASSHLKSFFFVFPSFFFFLNRRNFFPLFIISHFYWLLFTNFTYILNKTNEENMMEMKRRCLFDIPFLVIDFFSFSSVLCRLSKSIFNFLFFSFYSSSQFEYRHSTLSNALMLFYVCYIAIWNSLFHIISFFSFFIFFSIKLSKRFPYESHDWESVDEICNIKIEYLFVYRYVRRNGYLKGRKRYFTWGRNKNLMIFLFSCSVHTYWMRIQFNKILNFFFHFTPF